MGYDNPLQNEYESSRHNEGPWCDDCHGYTHMPYCPSYEKPSNEQPASAPGSEARDLIKASALQLACKNHQVYDTDLSLHLLGAVRELNEQHQQHAEQLRFLANRAEELSSLLAGMTTERDAWRRGMMLVLDELAGFEINNAPHIRIRKLREAVRGVAIMLNTELERYEQEPWAQRVRAALNHAEQGEGSDELSHVETEESDPDNA